MPYYDSRTPQGLEQLRRYRASFCRLLEKPGLNMSEKDGHEIAFASTNDNRRIPPQIFEVDGTRRVSEEV